MPSPRPRPARLFILAALLAALLPSLALGWAGIQHMHITRAAARNVPNEMVGFRAFARPMVYPSMFPDLWRLWDAAEGPRHYFEPDRLPPGFDLGALSTDRLHAFRNQLSVKPDLLGIGPWTINDLMEDMTEAMRTNDWMWAARCGSALAHYLGDLHMPLHCTRNYNGQETGQYGVHHRVESDMTKSFVGSQDILPPPAVYLDEPFRAIMGWCLESADAAVEILTADRAATAVAEGATDSETYYLKLWELTSDIILERLSSAAGNLSSIYYTAWVNAGRPAIPEPFEELPVFSIFSGVGIDPPEFENRQRSSQQRKYDLIIWSVMGAICVIVIASSLYRGAKLRKALKAK
ncbi:MAG: hypothetical protein GX803_09680 [Lentisphaerae bacterium]|jgi:hypothetical protein|nr:hypothetical protein [Lentisphaerota bacterium]